MSLNPPLLKLVPPLLENVHRGGEAMADILHQLLSRVPVTIGHQVQQAIAQTFTHGSLPSVLGTLQIQ